MRRYPPPQIMPMQRQQGPLGALGNFAMNKGMTAGLNAMFPGGGIAKEAATAVAPSLIPRFNMGGPLGGNQTKEGLMEARKLGALTQDEYLKAMAHAGYLNKGGGIHIKPENKGKFTAKAKGAGMGVQAYARKVLADPNADPATKKQANFARNAAAWHKEDGGRIGPLSKTVHKTADGESYEMNYHNPLAGGSSSGEK